MDGDGDSDGGGGDGGLEEEPERERDGVEREEDGEASALVIVAHARSRDMDMNMMSHKGDKSQLRQRFARFDGDLYTAMLRPICLQRVLVQCQCRVQTVSRRGVNCRELSHNNCC